MSVSVRVEVREYPDGDQPHHTLVVRNHWNTTDRVVLEIGGKEYVFIAKHLRLAIDNATNHK